MVLLVHDAAVVFFPVIGLQGEAMVVLPLGQELLLEE